MTPLPNRLAVYFAGIAALLGAAIPVIGNFDWQSTAGVLGGLAALATVVSVWLVNWGKWERGEGQGQMVGELDDEFDEASAELPESARAAATAELPADKA
jgi:hypothetical protein